MEISLSAAGGFELIAGPATFPDDWDRYLQAISDGITRALLSVGASTNVRAIVDIREVSGNTPPVGYQECARTAALAALWKMSTPE
jgi:hypothetical protein